MKIYAIALKRSKERYKYIKSHLINLGVEFKLIEAVDGSLLSQSEIEACCNMEQVIKSRKWLTNGAIGCALSHYKAYEEFLVTGNKAGFIIEDDVILPSDIKELLDEIEEHIEENEIILLYQTSFGPGKISSMGMIKLQHGSLVYPMDIRQTISAAAYVIGRKAAKHLVDSIKPINVTADSFYHYYELGCFSSFRLHFPSVIKIKNFKSSIDYLDNKSFKGKIAKIINDYKIPVFYQLVKKIRARNLNKMLGNFNFTDEISPIYKKKIES